VDDVDIHVAVHLVNELTLFSVFDTLDFKYGTLLKLYILFSNTCFPVRFNKNIKI
jgi:hypothetical protein